MANGVDLWAGDEARLLGIEIWCARPWTTHGPRKGDEELYGNLIASAGRVVNVTDADRYPGPWVYHKRNQWMVNHCDLLLSYWSGKEFGGTFQCRLYAQTKGVELENLWDK